MNNHTMLLTYKKSTPGTHVYESPDSDTCVNIYLKKASPFFGGKKPPEVLELTIALPATVSNIKEIG